MFYVSYGAGCNKTGLCIPQVKFMKSKPGAAMVEMGDCYAVDRAITHLNNNFLFAQRMNVWWVKPVHF